MSRSLQSLRQLMCEAQQALSVGNLGLGRLPTLLGSASWLWDMPPSAAVSRQDLGQGLQRRPCILGVQACPQECG